MAYTTHGYHIPGSSIDPQPDQGLQCGGISRCIQCQNETSLLMIYLKPEVKAATDELTEALRLTVEYVGVRTLPPVVGWSWYDALLKHDPETAEYLRKLHLRVVRDEYL